MKRLLIFSLAALVSSGLFATGIGWKSDARAGNDRVFSGFARSIIAGLNTAKMASLPANSGYGSPRIVVRTVDRDTGATSGTTSAAYTRRMLAALQKHGNGRFTFVALDALDGLIRDIRAAGLPAGETNARISELRVNAQADILVAGTVAAEPDGPYLSYQAVSTSTGELLASTSIEPLRALIQPITRPPVRPTVARSNAVPIQSRHSTIIEEAEQMLSEKGYDPGPIDGYLTAETRAALRAYPLDSALPVNGRLTRRVVDNLRRDSRSMTF